MNEEVKKLWVQALRSGEYAQTRCFLHDDKGFCCWGVLEDLYLKLMGKEWIPFSVELHSFRSSFNKAPDTPAVDLPSEDALKWAAIDMHTRTVTEVPLYHTPGDTTTHALLVLAVLNDNGATFGEIATIIEKEL